MRPYLLVCFILFFGATLMGQNSALSFDGQEEYLTLSHDGAYNIGDEFTIEAWIFAEEWRQFQWQGSIVNKDNQGPDRGFAFRCGDNGILSFVMAVDNVWQEAFTPQIMNSNQWHHVAVVVDNGTITLYIDGQPSGNSSFTGSITSSPDMDINIGGSPGFGGRNFHGVIDEVRIWNTARTQGELLDFNTVDLTGSEAGLVAYFPMNEGAGTIAGDLSATGNSCSLNFMDDSNWVDGYSLPDFDISVKEVYGVDVINMIDRPVKLRVDIQNTGIEPISDIDLAVSINGEMYNSETVTTTIAPNDLLAYEFVLPIDLIGLTDPEIMVMASHPNDGNALNNNATLEVKTGESDRIIVSDGILHKNGEQLNSILMTLPNDLQRYEQMLLNIDLNCPFGGCGAWDVLADLKAVTASGTYELARYITPYGIACGGWVVDITDFKSVLGGQVEFQTSVTVYTEEGWLVDMSIDLIDNNPTDTYSNLTTLWERSYHVYGDPGINDDLPELPVVLQSNTESSHVRMTITGHGQGNTNNAAEFYNVTHNLNVDGTPFQDHNLWKADCAQNPCENQAGSWLFPRAGWCPGESVTPFVINTTSVASPGGTVNLDYDLQDYTNLLNTGYNNSGHTEPYYRIYSYFIENASTPFVDYRNLKAVNVVPNLEGDNIASVNFSFENDGQGDLDSYTVNVFYNGSQIATETFNEVVGSGVSVQKNITLNTPIIGESAIMLEVASDQDNNPGDNVVKSGVLTNLEEILATHKFQVFPTPTATGEVLIQHDVYWQGSQVRIFHSTGALVQEIRLRGANNNAIQLPAPGAYWYQLVHPNQQVTTGGKLLYVK